MPVNSEVLVDLKNIESLACVIVDTFFNFETFFNISMKLHLKIFYLIWT